MSKVAIISDTHWGCRSDSTVLQYWQKRFLDNVFYPTLDEYNVKTVLHGGDYGDRRKYTNHQTINFVETHYRQPLRTRGITEHVLVGNHDCFYRDSTAVNSIQELYRHDDRLTVYTQPTEIDVDGCGILMLPWICGNNREASEKLIASSSCAVVLGHLELSGFQMYRGMPNHEGMDPHVFDRYELVMSGHYHHKSQSGPIQYLGAPYPMVWSDYRDPRGFHLFDTSTRQLTFIENPYSAFARLVYDDLNQPHAYIEQLVAGILASNSEYYDAYVKVVVKNRTQPYWFDIMMDALGKVNTQDVMVVDDIVADATEVTSDAISTDVDTLTIMRDYVEGLAVSCDKRELQTYLHQLYHEAVTTTQSSRMS